MELKEDPDYVKIDSDAHPIQIVASGNSTEDNVFLLQQENIESIMRKIPKNTKVAILSVVGAFRSGKSFLLTFFLRYLRNGSSDDPSLNWMTIDGTKLSEGNRNDKSNSETNEGNRRDGFAWAGGQNRQTTGIWMWSEPFIRKVASYPEPIAILLMDTQGMFDNETTMALTARIFGLSTLISSYQIYNVDKRIQEDNLQHLALFSEYGRMALGENIPENGSDTSTKSQVESTTTTSTSSTNTNTTSNTTTTTSLNEVDNKNKEEEKNEIKTTTIPTPTLTTVQSQISNTTLPSKTPAPMIRQRSAKMKIAGQKPFQRIEFLVRDWQNFEKDWEELIEEHGSEDKVFQILHNEMIEYLSQVIKARAASDLQSTRDQISKCFDKVTCFLLPHPGQTVTKRNYNGDLGKIDDSFKSLLNRYVRNIFDVIIEPKMINNRYLTASELLTFVHAYASIFQDEESRFPKAMTMLEATSEANNRNAYDLAIAEYRTTMDRVAGPEAPFTKESQLNIIHLDTLDKALNLFDNIAEMGAETAIEKVRTQLLTDIEKERVRYFDANSNRNPFKNVEFYAIPFVIAATSWILAVVVDKTCSTDLCEQAEDGFQNIYLFIFFGFVILTWRHIVGSWEYLKEILPLLLNGRIGGLSTLAAATKATTTTSSSATSTSK